MIRENIELTRAHIKKACERSGRPVTDVTLIAVTKTKPIEMLQEAYDAGSREFGENKVQEILIKTPLLPEDIHWHMIGHLQTNKVKQIIDKVVMIHSVDSVELAVIIEKEAAKINRFIDILLEVNVAQEESKTGFNMEQVNDAILRISEFPHIKIKGLMTIAPFVENSEENRGIFKKLYQLYVDIKSKNIDNVSMSVLSMGMTGDYEVAIEEGATMVRVGTGIFGSRY
ncbi:MAG: YggS family pyridoxal phosphate-dependent enzyme [Clostridium sp.]